MKNSINTYSLRVASDDTKKRRRYNVLQENSKTKKIRIVARNLSFAEAHDLSINIDVLMERYYKKKVFKNVLLIVLIIMCIMIYGYLLVNNSL